MTVAPLPPEKFPLWRITLFVILSGIVGACGVVDYSLGRDSFAAGSKSRDLGAIYFHFADSAEPYKVNVSRISHGYALQSPIMSDADGSQANIVLSRTKDYKYFLGVQGKFTF